MKKDDLYVLINTLTATEKKLFKEKYAAKADTNFVRLFDAIAKGEVKNDADARKHFAGENLTINFSNTKAYLYGALLAILHEQLQPKYARLRILQQIEYAETLLSRKLSEQAEDMLLAALAEAQQAEEFELEQFLLWTLARLLATLQRGQEYLQLAQKADEKVNEDKQLKALFYEAHHAYLQRGKKGAKDLLAFANHPLLASKKKYSSNKAAASAATTKSLLYTVERNYTKALENNLVLVNAQRLRAHTSVTNEVGYINALFNAALAARSANKNTGTYIQQMEQYKPISKWAITNKFVCLLRLKLNNYITHTRNTEGKKLLKWIEDELPLHQNELNEAELIKLHISIAGLCLKEQEYNRALDYLLLFSQSKIAKENRPVIYRVAMLYQLIAHYEMKNFEWLATTLRNYKYFQQTNDTFYLVEKHTLEFLSKAIKLTDSKARAQAKQNFEADLWQATQNEQGGIIYLKNIDWIKTR